MGFQRNNCWIFDIESISGIAIFTGNSSEIDYNKFITRNPYIMLGKPLIRGTRITVELRENCSGLSDQEIINIAKSFLTNRTGRIGQNSGINVNTLGTGKIIHDKCFVFVKGENYKLN